MTLSESDRSEVQQMIIASAQATVDNANRFGLTWRRIPATVVNGSDPSAIQIVLDGDEETNVILAVSLIGGVTTDARIMVDVVPPSGLYVIGSAPGSQSPGYRFIERVLLTVDVTLSAADYAGIQLFDVEMVGGGGAGGGAPLTAGSQSSLGGAGGSGAYARKAILPADIDWTAAVVIGQGGTGVSAANGNDGTATTFLGIMSAGGGIGGEALAAGGAFANVTGGFGGTATGGDINIRGSDGMNAIRVPTGLIGCIPSGSASGLYGNSCRPAGTDAGADGNDARVYGNGGGGAHNTASQGTNKTGGNGSDGCVQMTLYA